MMGAPKLGDRVRVSAVHEGLLIEGDQHCGKLQRDDGTTVSFGGPPHVTVEVLASPVYVNHDATEPRAGDVVRDRHGRTYVRSAARWFRPNDGIYYTDTVGPLTLLVRDGQVIA